MLFSILILSWLFFFLKKGLFFFYLWQVKEFRKDRFFAEIKNNRQLVFSKRDLVSLLGVLAIVFLPEKISYFIAFLYYPLLFLANFLKEKGRIPKIKFPQFTKKIIFLVGSFYLLFFFCFFYLLFSPKIKFFILFLFLSEIFLFFIILLWTLPFVFLNNFLKEKTFSQARKKREIFKNLVVVGIAGSYGKTSTKEFLWSLLKEKFSPENVLRTEKNENTEIAIANLILNKLKETHRFLIAEIGAYKVGEIKKVMSFLKPQIGILTGISLQHLELFGSLEKIKKAKMEIVENLSENGLAVFNVSKENVYQIARAFSRKKKFLYSLEKKEGVDLWTENIKVEKDCLEFDLVNKNKRERIKLNLIGLQNIENFLGASAVGINLGLNLKEIRKIAPKIPPSFSSMKKINLENGFTVIDDSYNLNFEGIVSALNYLKIYQGKKIVIMPCLIEIGPLKEKIHQKIGEKLKETSCEAIILEKNCFESIKKIFPKAILAQSKKEIFSSIRRLKIKKSDVVLLEGRNKFKKEILEFLEHMNLQE